MSKDRKDGKYIKATDAMHVIMPYLFDKRAEAEVSTREIFDITELKKWVDKKNKKLDFKLTYFQVLTSIFSKVVYNRPLLNRFVQGNRMYDRNYVSVAFVAKDKFSDSAEEKMIVLKIDENKNTVELGREMAIDIFKTRSDGTNDLDQFLKLLGSLPRWLFRIIVKFVKWLDYHGWVPASLCDTDSNYATILLSNLGSIGCDSCYHHLNNYGTNSIMITIGTIYEEKGRVYVDVTATLDERIADGFYFAKSLKLAKYIALHPELLDEKIGEKVNYEQE